MKFSLFAAWLIFSAPVFSQDTLQQVVAGRYNSEQQQAKPYVILISGDGFRYDLAAKYNAANLLRLRSSGVEAEYMRASYPSLTFPNHYSIVTGLYPSHHGLVNNTFYDAVKNDIYSMYNRKLVTDGSWYGGTPIWVLAEQQGMVSACFYWPGSEAAIQGLRPTYYYDYTDKIDIDTRIRTVKEWLLLPAERRPHFISFYFPQVDHELHDHGPDSEEAREAVHFVDQSIGKLVATIDSLHLPVNYVFVSDHGMAVVDKQKAIPLPISIDTSKFLVPSGSALLHLYARNRKDIKPAYKALRKEAKGYSVYLAKNMPPKWHFSKKDDVFNRIGDIVLVPELPGFFHLGNRAVTNIGYHGFDPFIQDLFASFYAWGPGFKSQLKIKAFDNIHIYPMLAKLLGLEYSFKIDGRLEVLEEVLK